MLRVPYTGVPTVSPEVDPTPAEHVNASPEMFGAGIARGLDKLGQTGMDYAMAQAHMINEMQANDITVDATHRQNEAYFEFQKLEGRSAVDGYPAFAKNIQQIGQDTVEKATNPAQKLMLSNFMRSQSDRMINYGDRHRAEQYRVWHKTSTDDSISNFGNNAEIGRNNEDVGPDGLTDTERNIDAAGIKAENAAHDRLVPLGQDPSSDAASQISAEGAKTRGKIVSQVVQTLANEGQLGAADGLYRKYATKIDSASINSIQKFLQPRLEEARIQSMLPKYTGLQQSTLPSSISTMLETGKKDPLKGVSNISPDSNGSKSYGNFGLNSQGSAQRFVAEFGQDFGFTAQPGTAAFDAQWKEAAKTDPGKLHAAEMAWYEKNISSRVSSDLAHIGVPSDMANDPRVQAYFDDRLVQYGEKSVDAYKNRIAKAAQGANGDPVAFLEQMTDADRAAYKSDFRSAIRTGVYGEQGHLNRTGRRLELALGIGSETQGAPVASEADAIKKAMADTQNEPLAFQQKLTGRISKYYNEQRAANADERRGLSQSVPDIIQGTLLGNDSLTFPDEAIKRAYPEKYDQWREQYDQAKQLGPMLQQAQFASNEDLNDIVRDIASGQGYRSELLKTHRKGLTEGVGTAGADSEGDYSRMKATALTQLQGILKRRVEALQNDPVAYVSGSPELQERRAAMDAIPKDDLEARRQADLQFMGTAQRIQTEMGVPEGQQHVLSKDRALGLVHAITDPATTPNVLSTMQGLQKQFGPQWGNVYKDLVTMGGLPTGYQSMLQLDAQNASLLARALNEGNTKDDKEKFSWDAALGKPLSKGAGSNKGALDSAIDNDSRVIQFRDSLVNQGIPAQMADSYLHDIKTLAYARSFYAHDTDAATSAIKGFMDKWEFMSGARVPSDKYSDIKTAMRNVTRDMSPTTLSVPDMYKNYEFAPAPSSYVDHATAAISWVNLPDASGMVAKDHGNKIMRWANGAPVIIRFDHPENWRQMQAQP